MGHTDYQITALAFCRQVPTLLKLLTRAVANGMTERLSSFRQSGSDMGLLHLAVRSGKSDVVAALLEGSDMANWEV